MTYQEANALVDDFSLGIFIECRKIIHKALEKQIPKKPRKTRSEIVCPTCNTLVGSNPVISTIIGYFK